MDWNNILNEYMSMSKGHFVLENLIYSYKKYLLDNSKYKNGTITEELNYLHNFDKFLKLTYPELNSVKQIKDTHIIAFRRFCSECLKNRNKTTNKKIRAIKKFLDYLTLVRHKLEYNPATKVPYLKTDKEKPPRYISKDNLRLILLTMEKMKFGIRDKCITMLIACLGLQVKEVFNLRIDDLEMKNKKIHIIRQGTTYTFPINDNLYICLKDYLSMRNDFITNNYESYNNYLFLSHTGKPYTPRAYQYKFKKALEIADIKGNYTPQNVRSSFAYYMAKKHDEDTMRKILNQTKVSHFYIDEVNNNPLMSYK